MVMIKVMSSWWSPAAAVLLWRRLRGTANSGDPSFLRSGEIDGEGRRAILGYEIDVAMSQN
uniref:Uncharacterized protein n=1 Tax=Oryza glumipatula TaxID=40148 RepID=A0A0D9YMQ3_9ORYZ